MPSSASQQRLLGCLQWAMLHEAAAAGDLEAGLQAIARARSERASRVSVADLLNLRLSLVDRDFTDSDYPHLLALAELGRGERRVTGAVAVVVGSMLGQGGACRGGAKGRYAGRCLLCAPCLATVAAAPAA
jgi:hypothetical protein